MNIDVLIQNERVYSSHCVKLLFERSGDDFTVKINENLGDEPTEEVYFIFEIHSISSTIQANDDVTLKNEDGVEIGFICFGNDLVNKPLNEYTKIKLVGLNLEYISETNNTVLSESELYVLNKSYALIHSESAEHYKSFLLNSSGIWGGFPHSNSNSLYKKDINEIVAISNIHLPTAEHEFKLLGAVSSNNGFDRFLKKYHMLELLYDYICVLKLKTMESSIKNFRGVMQDYSREEFKSLKSLLDDYVTNVDGIISVMQDADEFESVVTKVFHLYSKDSNPLKNESKWLMFKELISECDLSLAKCRSKKLCNNSNEDHRLFILNVTTYWIYRIRCSIAHNKIGEFIFEPEDEKFVVEIGEKLLDCIISKVLSNPDLKSMFDKDNQIKELLASAEGG